MSILVEEVVLVDQNDQPVGVEEKLIAHRTGKLHRAISVFLFNSKGQMLLQKRDEKKYHSGGLWTNACCSHPRPGEQVIEAAKRRLFEEMGIECKLEKKFDFIYEAKLDQGLTEHEFDHVFFGHFDGKPKLNLEEASDYRWVDMDALFEECDAHPERFTVWFQKILNGLK
jgi:isopentenyl-diphosphate delta-isomerase